MNNVTIELTDIEVVEELKVVVQTLRDTLETLLEDSDDENEEKEIIGSSLEEIENIFSVLSWENAVEYTQKNIARINELSAFGEGEAEDFLLRYCLLVEQSIDSFSDDGYILESDIFGDYDIDSDNESGEINLTLVKVLRTLYQKQLLALIRSQEKDTVLNAVNAISRDISATLPVINGKDWKLLSFYIQALLEKKINLDVTTHRLLAQLDMRLSSLLSHRIVEPNVSEELIVAVNALPNGLGFVEKNVLIQDIYSISPIVYKHFGLALKDELVKIHEQLERVYLDQAQRLRLEEYLPFFEKLIKVLHFMGLKRLSLLVEGLSVSFNQLATAEESMTEEYFNRVVSQFWVLESFLSDLWSRRNQPVPLSYNESKNWAYINAKTSALKLFVSLYKKIREQISATNDSSELSELQSKLYSAVKAEYMLSIVHDLTRYFTDDFMNESLSKESLTEIVLAVEYISNMNFENRAIAQDIIHSAKSILREHVPIVASAKFSARKEVLDKDMIEAFTDDLHSLERDFGVIVNASQPINEEQYNDLIRIAHTLRGNANIMKMHDAHQVAATLENNMRANTNYNADQIAVYKKTIANIIEQFKEFLQDVPRG